MPDACNSVDTGFDYEQHERYQLPLRACEDGQINHDSLTSLSSNLEITMFVTIWLLTPTRFPI